MSLQVLYYEPRLDYTGKELAPHFLLKKFGLRGSALGAFRGACEVLTEDLVDLEDQLEHDFIRAGEMVHFIGEFFGITLREGVLLQRLVMATLRDDLQTEISKRLSPSIQNQLLRSGDDLMFQGRKLSVSIVTASPVSVLLHVGINIDPSGAPVAAIGLAELDLDPDLFAKRALAKIQQEWDQMQWACAKVRPVM